MARKVEYEKMTPSELELILKKNPVAIVPTGLLEWHGEHLPLGFDALKAHGIALRLGRKIGAVVLPPNFWGVPGFGRFQGTLIFSEETMRRLFLELLGQLEKIGARVIVLLTGHYGPLQVNLVKKVAAEFMEKRKVKVIAQPEYEGVQDEKGREPADHAGAWETSFGLYLFPELVRMKKFQPGECRITRFDNPAPFWLQPAPPHMWRPTEESPWVWTEDLRKTASAKKGGKMILKIIRNLERKIEEAKKELGIK